MKTELIMLGTGHAMVTKCYNTCFLLKNKEEYTLVDAGGGNGILVQMEKAEVSFLQLHRMFITHAHTDHILGSIWVIRKVATLMNRGEYKGNFVIYGHDKVIMLLRFFSEQMLPKKFTRFIDHQILIKEVKDGDVIKAADMDVTFFDIHSKKEKQYGFLAVLPDAQRLVCLGDEPYNEENSVYVKSCDWMLSEAFCLDEEKDIYKPYEKHHSTALDGGKTAQKLGIKNLILYHTEDSDLKNRQIRYTREAQTYYTGNVFVPDDLERIQL